MTAPTVTVYTSPSCPACTLTKRHLDRIGVPYTEHAIDETVRVCAEELGITSAPIVCANVDGVEVEPWGGFRPDRLNALKGYA